ncbi:MAG: hypothetical protein FWE53_04730 [Firmicutes bacterium]|nr:hypothetical protein [Bacillota bacterium]
MKKPTRKLASVFLCCGFLFVCLAGCFDGQSLEDEIYNEMRGTMNGVRVTYAVNYDDRNTSAENHQQSIVERNRFYTDAAQQMEAMAELLLTGLAGEYGKGVDAGTEIDLGFGSSYGPYNFPAGLQPAAPNITIFDTNFLAIDLPRVGAVAAGTGFEPEINPSVRWLLNMSDFSVLSITAEAYRSAFVARYKPFIMVRLYEIAAGLPATAYTTNITALEDRLTQLYASPPALGFSPAHEGQIKTMLLDEMIGASAVSQDTAGRPKTYTTPFIDDNSDGVYTPGEEFLDLAGLGYYVQTYTENMNNLLYFRNYTETIDRIVGECSLEFPYALKLEVRDLNPNEAIRKAGVNPQTNTTRLTMESQEYLNAVFMIKENIEMEGLIIGFDPDTNMEINVSMRVLNAGVLVIQKHLATMELKSGSNVAFEEDSNYIELEIAEEPGLEGLVGLKLPAFASAATAPGRGHHITAANYTLAQKYVTVPSLSPSGGTSVVYAEAGTSYIEFVFDVVKNPMSPNANYKFRFMILPISA